MNIQPGILLTRPEGYNGPLTDKLRQAGYRVLERPFLTIHPLDENEEIRRCVKNLDRYDVVVFVSRTAVTFGMPHLLRSWPQWPRQLLWYAAGAQTARELRAFDINAAYPETAGSDGLIRFRNWQDVERVLIVRGKGGLELLRQSLEAGGVNVDYLEVYARGTRHWPDLKQDIQQGDIIVITSGAAIEPLCQSLDPGELAQVTIVAPSERVRKLATCRGLQNTVVTPSLNDAGLMETINGIISRG